MSRKNIHIVQVSWDEAVFQKKAGSDSRLRQLEYAAELERQAPGSQMTILVLVRSRSLRRVQETNLCLIPVQFHGKTGFLRLFFKLRQLHRKSPIHVLTCQDVAQMGWWVLLFGFIHRIPVVGQIHYDFFSPFAKKDCFGSGWKAELRYSITLGLLPFFSALRVTSQRVHRGLIERGLKIPVLIIPVPVTMHPSESEDDKKRAPLVLFVGRLVWQKNLFLWVHVAARVVELEKAAKFRIIGDGVLKDELEQEILKMGIASSVELMGEVPYDQLCLHYKEASVFLFTSFSEGFGRVLVEAYIHQLPVVATRTTGVEDIIDHGVTGFMHEAHELQELARSTVRLLQDEDLRIKMGIAGKKKVCNQFAPKKLIQRWVALLIDHAPLQK